ncbi:MAG: caspase family protein [Myxococcota bacterium]|jgi:hypothetical protein|nr:caspase family protein [Myxococcota bacterium]
MTQHSAAPRVDPARTWTVLVGILDYPGQGFAPRGRQDVRLDRALAAWGVPDAQRRCLLDADATAEAIARTLADVTHRAGRDDSLLFYFAGHGNELPEGFALSARDVRSFCASSPRASEPSAARPSCSPRIVVSPARSRRSAMRSTIAASRLE